MSKSILDEYIRRRQNGTAVYNPQKVQYGQGAVYNPSAYRQATESADQNGQVPVYRPNQWRKPAMIKAPTATADDTTTLDTVPPTGGTESNVMTWDDQIDIEIQNAAKKVLEVSNRKFQYNALESPIYSIMRQEYLKEADLAEGRATAAAAQNAGGFGSSFAVMAGEEARRQVMEGFYDQEDELYAAARSEFEAEKASAFDNYLKLRELKAMEKERLATEIPTTMTLDDGTTVEVTDEARNLYEGYLDSFMEGTGYDTLKTAMINGGASEADADQAIAMFKRLGSATISDQISALGTSPTLSGAAEIMAQAKMNGTEAEVLPKVSAAVSKGFTEALDDPSSAYGLLGVEPEEWDAMFAEYTDPDERAAAQKAYLLKAAGEARKSGLISGTGYTRLLRRDVVASVEDIIENETNKPVSDVAEVVISMQNYKDAGYITEAEYDRVIGTIAEMVDMDTMWKTQTAEKSTKDAKKFVKEALKHLEYLGYTPSQSTERQIMEALDRSEDIMDLYENPGIKLVSNLLEKLEDTTGIMTPEKWFSMTADQFAAIKEIQKKKKK